LKNLLALLLIAVFFIGCSEKMIVITPDKKEVEEKKVILLPPPVEDDEIITEPMIEEKVEKEESIYKKIALIYPSKVVGPYAKTTVNTLTSYLLYLNLPFKLETFDSIDESVENINTQISLLKEQGYEKVIALYTQAGFEVLNIHDDLYDLEIYFPLINKNEIVTQKDNFVFGGISYTRQLELLHSVASQNNSMFYVESYIGNKLKDAYTSIFGMDVNIKEIERANNQYKYIMDDERLKESTVMLNTPIIKSSIIMSQLTAYEVNPIAILSTQINYNPLLIKLTQDIDRTNFFVVNSIGKSDDYLQEYTNLLEADIVYNWVDYSSLVGVNYLINKDGDINIVDTTVEENQALYKPYLFKSTSYGFEKLSGLEEN